MIQKMSIYLGEWILVWIFIWMVFIDYLPKHAHYDYFGLVSPLLLIVLPFYGSQLTSDAYPLVIIPGILFWTITTIVIFVVKKK
jgi:hypothetical protein